MVLLELNDCVASEVAGWSCVLLLLIFVPFSGLQASAEKQLLGTETARAMRAKGVTAIICGLSANDMQNQFLDAGATAFMRKPIPCTKEEMLEELLRILG